MEVQNNLTCQGRYNTILWLESAPRGRGTEVGPWRIFLFYLSMSFRGGHSSNDYAWCAVENRLIYIAAYGWYMFLKKGGTGVWIAGLWWLTMKL